MNHAKEAFLQTWEQEFKTTLKILKAYPHDKQDLVPAPKLRSATGLAWTFVIEESVMGRGICAGNIDWSKMTPPPATLKEVIDNFESDHAETVEMVRKMTDEEWNSSIGFMVGPNTPGMVKRSDLLWIMLHDQIHHRGQFSVYLRCAGAKVPSIYGPSADEPWM